MNNYMNKTRRFKNWLDELRYRVSMDGELDEKYQNGVYDIAINIAETIQNNDLKEDDLINYIYNAIKYGKGV